MSCCRKTGIHQLYRAVHTYYEEVVARQAEDSLAGAAAGCFAVPWQLWHEVLSRDLGLFFGV